MGEKEYPYINPIEFEDYCFLGIEYEGYVIGVGFAFVDRNVWVDYSRSMYCVKKMSSFQYVDTSDFQRKKSLENGFPPALTNTAYDKSSFTTSNKTFPKTATSNKTDSSSQHKNMESRTQTEEVNTSFSKKVNNIVNATNNLLVQSSADIIGGSDVLLNEFAYLQFRKANQYLSKLNNRLNTLHKIPLQTRYDIDFEILWNGHRRYGNRRLTLSDEIKVLRNYRASFYDTYSHLPYDNNGLIKKGKELTKITYGEKAVKIDKYSRLAGKFALGIQIGVSAYNVIDAYYNDDPRSGRVAIKAGADVVVGGLCLMLGGPVAWTVGAAYLIVDICGGWDALIDGVYYKINPEQESLDKFELKRLGRE